MISNKNDSNTNGLFDKNSSQKDNKLFSSIENNKNSIFDKKSYSNTLFSQSEKKDPIQSSLFDNSTTLTNDKNKTGLFSNQIKSNN